jgi:hypothetical protein
VIQYTAKATRASLRQGCTIAVDGVPGEGDRLAFEFPNNSRLSGDVMSGSLSSMIVNVGDTTVTFRPWANGDDVIGLVAGWTRWTVA